MTAPSEVDVVVSGTGDEAGTSYVDWPAIIGGIILASAISVLLITFGSAVGLSFTDFNAPDGASPIWIAIAAATWLLWVQVSSFMAGGYLTGRLRKRHLDATEEEVDVRDGAHGLLVWAGALVLGAVLALGGIGAAANVVGSTAATLTTAASNVAGDATEGADPSAYFVDLLFRPAGPEAAAAAQAPAAAEAPATAAPDTPTPEVGQPAAAPSATPAAMPAAATPEQSEMARGEATRIFAQAALTDLPDSDRAYLVQLVSRQTGMSEEQANARVDDVLTSVEAAQQQAADAADEARKMGILGAFLVAASFLVSAVGAYWAAQVGGRHRDEGTSFRGVFRRF